MFTARARVDRDAPIGAIDRRLFGSFVEHLGRCVYDGIYEPGHPTADSEGFRSDVLDLVGELGVTTVRYPGGNFVSGFRWEDSVGPREARPRRVDLAWHSLETNAVGLDEFARWCNKAGLELMLAVNLGTRGVQEAVDLFEYSNIRGGTALSNQRIENGAPEPYAVRMWCLGNEMDGPWQLGHRSADAYGALAAMTARALKQFDADVELVACGSSSRAMPTFGAWERAVLEHCFDDVEFISCHAYYSHEDGALGQFLASAVDMDRFIEEVTEVIDSERARRNSSHEVNISFDEWNVWDINRYHEQDKVTDPQDWPEAPRLLEDSYTVADAVVVGGLLMSLVRHADRVKAASLAQLVNVIAPIMTEPGGIAWRQTTFFPFAITARLARGMSHVVTIDAPSYEAGVHGATALVDVVATVDGDAIALFVVNRAEGDVGEVSIDLSSFGSVEVVEAITLSDDDISAQNTLAEPNRVEPTANGTASVEVGLVAITVPAVSWTAVALRIVS